jgi:hypothetical protein
MVAERTIRPVIGNKDGQLTAGELAAETTVLDAFGQAATYEVTVTMNLRCAARARRREIGALSAEVPTKGSQIFIHSAMASD